MTYRKVIQWAVMDALGNMHSRHFNLSPASKRCREYNHRHRHGFNFQGPFSIKHLGDDPIAWHDLGACAQCRHNLDEHANRRRQA